MGEAFDSLGLDYGAGSDDHDREHREHRERRERGGHGEHRERGEHRDPEPEALDLELTVRDPEMLRELRAHAAGSDREDYALTALRLGLLALRQARGELDAETIRRESDLLLGGLEARLTEHQRSVQEHLAGALREYFDPDSGRFAERVERLVRRDGELEEVLRRQVGPGDSELVRTLSAHFGAESPLMRMLSPEASEGLLGALGRTLEESLHAQRERILGEFSLDNKDGALARLVEELGGQHERALAELSLDHEDSALSRLVRRVEQAQRQIAGEFSLDEEQSALARMRRELMEVLQGHRDDHARFREEVRVALQDMVARREEAGRSTRHGEDFEGAVVEFLRREAAGRGDLVSHTGATTGAIRHCKVGDAVVEIGPEAAAAGARIAVEAKQEAGWDAERARPELERARKNREAQVGLFVLSRRAAAEGTEPLARYGPDIVAVWDAEDPASDVYLRAALSLARALCTRAAAARDTGRADFEAINRAIRGIEKQAEGLDKIETLTTTIRSNSEGVLKRAGIMRRELEREVESLEERVRDLRALVQAEDQGEREGAGEREGERAERAE